MIGIIYTIDLKWLHSLLSEINRTADSMVIGNIYREMFLRITASLLIVIWTSMSVLDLGVNRGGSLISRNRSSLRIQCQELMACVMQFLAWHALCSSWHGMRYAVPGVACDMQFLAWHDLCSSLF